ncbi:MAG TPA: DUF3168 domain-containing protein [Devosiaceae bacterium]|jgi:hypothetical protein
MSALTIGVRLLLADAGIVAKVGSSVYPITAPQGAEGPYIVVGLVHEEQDFLLAGASGCFFSRVEIQCVASTGPEADAIGEAVKACMTTVLNATVMSGGDNPVEIGTATAWKEGTDLLDFTDDRAVFRRLLDYRLHWTTP